MNLRLTTKLLALGLVASTALIGCGEEDSTDGAHDDVHEIALVDRDHDEEFADYHEDHWHGQIELEADADDDDYKSVGFVFYDEDENEVDIPLGEDGYDYDVELEHDEHAWTDLHSDHFHIGGEEEGQTVVYFGFDRDGETFFDTRGQGLSVFVDDHDNDHTHDELEVSDFSLLDRAHDPPQEVAELHDDHWDGEFADGIELDVADDPDSYETAAAGEGEAVSLGADAEEAHDDHGHHIDFDGDPYEFDVEYHPDGDHEHIAVESHGDHVHVVGLEDGHAHVHFQIVDRVEDEVVWESPDFEFDVH